MAAPEFMYLNEQAVRVTSWKQDDATGMIELVVIAQGEADRDHLLDDFSREPVMIRVGTGSAIPMNVRSLDTSSTGTGSRSVHRLTVALRPEGASEPAVPQAPPEPADPVEARLDQIIRLLTEIRDDIRGMR